MDRTGTLVLPASIREALHVTAPTSFKAQVIGNRVELTPIQSENGVVIKERKGLFVASIGGPKFNAADAIKAMRDERE